MATGADVQARIALDTLLMKQRHMADQRAMEQRHAADQARFVARRQAENPNYPYGVNRPYDQSTHAVTGILSRTTPAYPYYGQSYYQMPARYHKKPDIFGNLLKGFALGAIGSALGYQFGSMDDYRAYESTDFYDNSSYIQGSTRYAQAGDAYFARGNYGFKAMMDAARDGYDAGGVQGADHRKYFQQQMLRDFYMRAVEKGEFQGGFKAYLYAALQDNINNPTGSMMPDPRAYLRADLVKYLDPEESRKFIETRNKSIEHHLKHGIGTDARGDFHGRFAPNTYAPDRPGYMPGMAKEVAKYEAAFPEGAPRTNLVPRSYRPNW